MKRFKGAKKTTWTRSRNQVGTDDMVGTGPSGAAYPIDRKTTGPLFTTLDATGGDDGVIALPYEQGIDNSLIGKKVYSHYFNMYGNITDVSAPYNNSQNVDIVTDIALDYTVAPPLGARGTLLEIYDYEYVSVSKSGNDENTGTPAASPKLTIQAAIDTAVVNYGYTHVQVLDSGVYDERLDLKGITVEAAAGQTPTIRYPITGWTGSGTLGGSVVNGLAEFVISGQPLCIAATSGGLYTSADGRAWTLSYLNGKDLRGCVVWDDSTGDGLYVANYTDGVINKVSLAGAVTTYATANNIKSGAEKVVSVASSSYGIIACVVDTTPDPDEFFNAIYYGSAWNIFDDTSVGVEFSIVKSIIFDITICLRKAISGGQIVILQDGEVSTLSNIGLFSGNAINAIDIGISGNSPIAIDSNYVYSLPDVRFNPTDWQRVGAHGVVSPSALVADPRGWLYVLGSGGNHSISRDGGRTWYTYGTAPAAKAVYAPSIFFRGVGLVAKSTDIAYEDMVQIRDSVESSEIRGFHVNGKNSNAQALRTLIQTESDTGFDYCDISNSYECNIVTDSDIAFAFKNSVARDMYNFVIGAQHISTGTGSIVRDIGSICISRHAPDDKIYNLTIFNSGIGFTGLNFQGLESCIIYNNQIDIYTIMQTDTLNIKDSVVGKIAGTENITLDNSSYSGPLLLPDGDIKDKSGGYGYDSVALALGAGAYKITRTSTDTDAVDTHIKYLPTGENIIFNVSNFTSSENADGEYSETWDGLKRRIELSWDSSQFADTQQLYKLLEVYGEEDAVFRYGNSDGTNWVPVISGVIDSVTDSSITITNTSSNVGKDQYKGYWILLDGTYFHVTGNNEADTSESITITVDGTHTALASEPYSIDYLLVKVDKSQPLQAMQYLTSSRVVTGYNLVLREVDSE